MNIVDQMTNELKTLRPDDLMLVHQLVISLKSRHNSAPGQRSFAPSQRVRRALRTSSGEAWADDILKSRDDRV